MGDLDEEISSICYNINDFLVKIKHFETFDEEKLE